MISGIFHSGSGLGNQLHRYVATRVLAMDKGYEFSMVAPENFKGAGFMKLDMGMVNSVMYNTEYPAGKVAPLTHLPFWEEKTSYYNPEFNFIEDNTIIDGEFQDERYFGHKLPIISSWLKVEPIDIPDNLCIMGFRGGEFALFPELFLPFDYWIKAMEIMREQRSGMQFRVVTDDPKLATEFFRGLDVEITHDIGMDWRQIRHAKYAVVANSSFYILPRLLRHDQHTPGWGLEDHTLTIAPRYWARHNTKEWSMPQNYYKCFMYL